MTVACIVRPAEVDAYPAPVFAALRTATDVVPCRIVFACCPTAGCARHVTAEARAACQRSDCAIRGGAHHELRSNP